MMKRQMYREYDAELMRRAVQLSMEEGEISLFRQ